MDRFFYYLLGVMALALITAVGVTAWRHHQVAAAAAIEASALPSPTSTPIKGSPKSPFSPGGDELPAASSPMQPASSIPMAPPVVLPTPVPWSPPNFGKVVTVSYPGFSVVYSVTLGNPLAVQYAMVGGAKPKRYPPPITVQTPNGRLIPAAGYARGAIALSKSISLYFGKAAGANTSLMPNICAFVPACLEGPWAQFSDLEARWAGEFGWIEVTAGPIFATPPTQTNGLVIPAAFYRVYRRSYGDSIAFIIPQTATSPDLSTYLTSISAVEAASGMSIFANTVPVEDRDQTAKAVW